jgi:hypothetical protein
MSISNIVPNVILPNDYNVPNTLTPYQCTMAIGFNKVNYGETSLTGFYDGVTPPSSGWTIYYTDGGGNLFIQVANNLDDLIEITNYLSGNANSYNDANAIVYYYGDTNQLGGTQILANYDLPNFVTGTNNYSELALCFLSGYSMSYDSFLGVIGFNYWIDLAQSNFLTINGTFAIAGSGAQTSFIFDGTTTYGSIAYSGENFVPIANTDYTISIWFNPSSLTGPQGLVGWGNYGTNEQVNALRLDDADLANYWWGDDLVAGTRLSIGNWYNAVCCYNGDTNTRSIYVNGTLVASDNPSGTHAVPDANNLTIGYTGLYSTYFNGKIQNVNIYNVCLTPAQILQNYYALQPIVI